MSEGLKPIYKNFSHGDVIFHDGEQAYSLFIIQKGQIRLFKPKGKGVVEIGVLRTGEVIGEMAFFEEEIHLQKRSCAAAAISQVELIEIPFELLQKSMTTINPWFKTIISTLTSRLKKTNMRLKELEDNHATLNYANKVNDYEFLKLTDVTKIIGLIFLCFKSHSEVKNSEFHLNRKTLSLYIQDLFQFQDLKLTSLLDILNQMNLLEIKDDVDRQPNILILKSLETLRNLFLYLNSEKNLQDDQRLRVSERGELLIEYILTDLKDENVSDIPPANIDRTMKLALTKYLNITNSMERYETEKGDIHFQLLLPCKTFGFLGDVVSLNHQTMIEIDPEKLLKYFPVIKFLNRLKKVNEANS